MVKRLQVTRPCARCGQTVTRETSIEENTPVVDYVLMCDRCEIEVEHRYRIPQEGVVETIIPALEEVQDIERESLEDTRVILEAFDDLAIDLDSYSIPRMKWRTRSETLRGVLSILPGVCFAKPVVADNSEGSKEFVVFLYDPEQERVRAFYAGHDAMSGKLARVIPARLVSRDGQLLSE